VARVVVTPTAVEDLDRLIRTLSLPSDTKARVRQSLSPLKQFPLLGAELEGLWAGFRFLLGPWRWIIVVCTYDATDDRVAIITIHDARSASSAVAHS
jgi:hypothetical protein